MSASLKLFCLPPAGASASMYVRWRRLLPDWIDVVPVELPGRGSRFGEPFVEDFDTLVRQLGQEVFSGLRDEYALFGHSMGALLAYGLALYQRERGGALPTVFLASGSPAPSSRDPERFAGKGDDEALIADLRKQGGTPEEIFEHPEMLRMTLDVLGADYRVCESFDYRAPPPLPVPLHVFAGRDDDIEPERIKAWRQETDGEFSIEWFEGGHFFVRHNEAAVLRAIWGRLQEQQSNGRRRHASNSFA
ncbi:MAG: alpha/beta fold hydrolase [Zoogloeaceae bacterium]|jgi:surfactin synthase thioesterase subunit|nr:alpha/beta fold hydrolase [Zoogloeaceae bacterium]